MINMTVYSVSSVTINFIYSTVLVYIDNNRYDNKSGVIHQGDDIDI